MRKRFQPDHYSILIVVVFFILFFWPATLAGRYFVGGDALLYSYPMRTVAWEMIRHGQLPLWTPTLLSGYPLLSMSQLALAYPLTWGYLFLSGHAAEQIYVLAPFLLAPIFTYLYARQIGRSRMASLLAGLTFGYGGLMASQIATYGILTNAVMWLPLVLVAIERARSKPFIPSVLWMTAAYAMSVMTGLGQGFLYVGIVAVAYAAFLSLTATSEQTASSLAQRFRPLFVCLVGMLLAACLAAFQILETMQAQRQSIRSRLSYEVFSGGAFTFAGVWRSFLAPFYHFLEEETFVVSLAALLALAAIAGLFWRENREPRLLFWLVVAVVSLVLMVGDNSPVYRLLYHIPLLNLFRVPARHAFEWTFSLAILAAFGWDRIAALIQSGKTVTARPLPVLFGMFLIIVTMAVGYGWWAATGKLPVANSPVLHTGLPEQGWLLWKLGFTVIVAICALWSLRLEKGVWRNALLALTVAVGCFVEPYILLQRWWFHFAKPPGYFTQVSSPTRFLQQFRTDENRIYTSVSQRYIFDLPRTEPHNLTALRGFHNAAGYEPLMSARYGKAFGNGGSFFTPGFNSPLDRQILSSNWQVLDLLNVRFMVEFSSPDTGFIVKEGSRFAAVDTAIELKPGAKTLLAGISAMDTLTLVSVLANSSGLKDGEVVAQIRLTASDGRVINREFQAGRDSAEWAHERPDVKATIRHRLANIFDNRPGEAFPVYRYWTRIDLGEKLNIDRIEIVNVSRNASLIISNITAYDSTADKAFLLTQRLPEQWRKVYDYDNVQIFENRRALPRAWLTPQAVFVSEEEALKRIRGESEQTFDPREVALLETSSPIGQAIPESKTDLRGEARIVSYEPGRLVIETRADKNAVLVVSEANYPGWEATIDDQPATVYAANYLLRGMIIPEGTHRVTMTYKPKPARIGAVISVLTLMLLAGLVIITIGGKK